MTGRVLIGRLESQKLFGYQTRSNKLLDRALPGPLWLSISTATACCVHTLWWQRHTTHRAKESISASVYGLLSSFHHARHIIKKEILIPGARAIYCCVLPGVMHARREIWSCITLWMKCDSQLSPFLQVPTQKLVGNGIYRTLRGLGFFNGSRPLVRKYWRTTGLYFPYGACYCRYKYFQ